MHGDAAGLGMSAPGSGSDSIMMPEGYYWARHPEDGSHFIVYRDPSSDERGVWWMCGIAHPIDHGFDESQIICPVAVPHN